MAEKYYYAVGRVRALEAGLLSHEQLALLADEADLQAAFTVLSESSYSDNLGKLSSPFDFEELCRLEEADLRSLLRGLAPGDELIAALLNRDYARFQTLAGTIFLRQLADALIDFDNLLTVLRLKNLDRPIPEAAAVGLIDQPLLFKVAALEPEAIAASLRHLPYSPALEPGFAELARTGLLAPLEKARDDYLIDQIKMEKADVSGAAPLVGFFLVKMAEIRTVRFILIGRLNRLESRQIKEHLRLSYV